MTTLIGNRVSLTIHDTNGTPHTAEGELAALAAAPGAATTPREPAPWACLVKITAADGVGAVIPYNACELTFLPDSEASVDVEGTLRRSALEARVVELDDENAALTAALAGAQKQIVALTSSLAAVSAPEASKIAAATKSGKGKS